jgi:DNA modification methylase
MTLHCGDCREVMAGMDADSVDAIVTDPPYGLAFMGKAWDHGVPGVEFWSAALRVAKPGAHLLAFGGTRTFHRLAVAIEDAGWEIRDTVMWVYGSGFPKSLDISKAIDRAAGAERAVVGRRTDRAATPKRDFRGGAFHAAAEHSVIDCSAITAPATPAARQWAGWGTALKPAWEPVIVARKPPRGTVAENVLRYGTGGLNVDGGRVGTNGEQPKGSGNPCKNAPREAIQPVRNGGNGGNETSPLGRFPANLIHDGSAEVVGLFSSAARFFYTAKASKADRDAGCEGLEERESKSTGWSGDSMPLRQNGTERKMPVARNHHPTVKPLSLMRYLVRLVTPPDGLILDPFMGSGSTGKAAYLEGFRFTGIDLDPEHVAIARARLDHIQCKQGLFADPPQEPA